VPPTEVPASFVVHVAVLLLVGALYVYSDSRGPLERLVTHLSGRAAARVRGGRVGQPR
jgi:hypothetical protein